jgi:hypothetical protein
MQIGLALIIWGREGGRRNDMLGKVGEDDARHLEKKRGIDNIDERLNSYGTTRTET